MANWYTADLHIGHKMVAAIRGFETVEKHDDKLRSEWSRLAGENDTVYDDALAFIDSLPGVRHLVAGNHDPVHPMHMSTYARMLPKFLQVFKAVSPFLRRKVDGHEFLLSHFPYVEWADGPERDPRPKYDQYRLPDLGLPLLHGHTHGTEKRHGRSFHVGVDAWGMKLVNERVVLDWLRELPPYEK